MGSGRRDGAEGGVRVNAILEHELTGIDANGKLCACGRPFDREHLGQVALAALNAPPSVDEMREQHRLHAGRWRDRANARRLERTRRILAEQQAEWERIAEYLDSLNLSFLDRIDWLEAHFPNAQKRERYA